MNRITHSGEFQATRSAEASKIASASNASGDVLYGTSPLGVNDIQYDVAVIMRLFRSFVRRHHGLDDLVAHLIEATRRRSRQHHRLRVL